MDWSRILVIWGKFSFERLFFLQFSGILRLKESYIGAPFAMFSVNDISMSFVSACVREILLTTVLLHCLAKTYVKKMRLVPSKQFND
jgi:hypothetical protein